MNNEQIMGLLYMALGVFIIVVLALIIFLVILKLKDKNKNQDNKTSNGNDKKNENIQTDTRQSIFDFMEFDKIEDNMIIQKNGNRFIMVVNCQGINYDLMSNVEKTGVEEGFVQFLNTIRHPIQLYVQTKTVNLEKSVEKYNNRLKEFQDKLNRMKMQYEQMRASERYTTEELNRAYYEITKQTNLVEYGRDIVYNTERMSLNKNVLTKQYYVIISYYATEASKGDFDKEEIKNIAFSELYTKAQSIIRTLYTCSVTGKILNSNELVDLLYAAYNRDDSEIYSAEKVLNAGFEDLYSTAPDVFEKRIKALDKEIEDKAMELAQEKVLEARTEKELKLMQKEEDMDNLIDEMAKIILGENKEYIGQDIVEAASEKIDEEKQKRTRKRTTKEKDKKEVKNNNVQEKKKTRRTTKTA